MKKILFPTDFSETANNAFLYALKIADRLGASIVTLHAYQKPAIVDFDLPLSLLKIYKTIQLEKFENYKDNIPALHALASENGLDHVQMSHVMANKEPLEAILHHAKKEQADMIVMGTKGASGLKEIFIGSIAGKVLENASCMVLAVPEKAEFKGSLKKIAFATNLEAKEKKALEKVISLALVLDAEIHCFHVDLKRSSSFSPEMETWTKDLATLYPKMYFHVEKGSTIEAAFTHFLEKHNIDILTMFGHKYNFLKKLFDYSLTKKMSYHLNTPILDIQENNLV